MWPENVRKTDLKIEFFRGSGAGGQNRNKRDTACRITHIPTGIVSSAQDERTQDRNRKLAFRRLAKKLVPLMKANQVEKPDSSRRIRTYHAIRNEVKDDRVPEKKWSYSEVLDGRIEDLLKNVRKKVVHDGQDSGRGYPSRDR